MTVCCRNAIAGLDRGKCSNAGLLLSRYLRVPVNQQGDEHNKERKELFDIAAHALKNPEVIGAYRQAFHRRKRWIETSAAQTVSALFETKGRMIIGLGGENVLETGLTLEHAYGVPIIPGSALKGLAAHYCTQTWGEREKGFDVSTRGKKGKVAGEFAKILFGDNDESGFIAFHDAWLTPESLKKQNFGLKQDVMTPHHGEYYSGNAAPTDFDDPNPVHFLSVTGQFSLAISCEDTGENGLEWAKLAFQLIREALEDRGIGGKTSSGYGRMKLLGEPSFFRGDGFIPSEGVASTIKPIEVTLASINKKGNPQFRAKDKGVRCVFLPGETIEPEMQKGETRTFWLIENRAEEEYVISSKKPS